MPSAFTNKSAKPDETTLSNLLGTAKPHWDNLVANLKERGIATEWKFYGAKHGWQLKATKGKVSVLYLMPHKGSFLAALALKGKALEAARAAKLPAALLKEIENAKEYSEGRAARVEVTGKTDVDTVKQLLACKLG